MVLMRINNKNTTRVSIILYFLLLIIPRECSYMTIIQPHCILHMAVFVFTNRARLSDGAAQAVTGPVAMPTSAWPSGGDSKFCERPLKEIQLTR